MLNSSNIYAGTQLDAGCFGWVVRAEAMGIIGAENTVKMIRSQTNMAAMEALVSEMKILIYLGSHLNVVSLLGACTKQMSKDKWKHLLSSWLGLNFEYLHIGELFIIIEYCPFGNLQNYLSKHRQGFINLVDGLGNMKSDTDTKEIPHVSQHETERHNPYEELLPDRRLATEWPGETVHEKLRINEFQMFSYSVYSGH